MPTKRPKVIVTRRLPQAVETRMAELFDVELNFTDVAMDAAALSDALARADVVVPTVTDNLTADVIAAAGPRLKLLANFGTGVDHIDLAAARAKDLVVTNTPGVLTDDTADMVMALILGVARIAGETAPLLIVSGASTYTNTDPFSQPMNSLPLYIFAAVRSGQPVFIERGFGAASVLLALVMLLFVTARMLARPKKGSR